MSASQFELSSKTFLSPGGGATVEVESGDGSSQTFRPLAASVLRPDAAELILLRAQLEGLWDEACTLMERESQVPDAIPAETILREAWAFSAEPGVLEWLGVNDLRGQFVDFVELAETSFSEGTIQSIRLCGNRPHSKDEWVSMALLVSVVTEAQLQEAWQSFADAVAQKVPAGVEGAFRLQLSFEWQD